MTEGLVEKAYDFCLPHTNGTYDLIPLVNGAWLRFARGNSLLQRFDPRTTEINDMMDREIFLSPEWRVKFLNLSNVWVKK